MEELRKTGIDVLGDVPWGTHFCQFYETKQDLLDILVPYFKAGLENNEFCMWITAEPLKEDEAKAAIAKVMPDFAQYQARGQIEILPYTEWHLKDGVFDGQRVLGSWVDKLNQSLARGYDGLRVSGNTFWLERNGWKNFTEYEAEVNNVISNYKMLALCTYSLDKCSASDAIDVISNHQLALLKKRGKWELIESPERKRADEAAEAERQRLNEVLDMLPAYLVLLSPDYHVPFANRFFRERFGESNGRRCFEYLFGRSEPCEVCETYKVLKTMAPLEWEWTGPDGRNYHIHDFPFTDIDGSTLIMEVGIDVTEQKRAQAETQTRAEQQAVIVQLGQLALSGAGLDKLFHEAVKQAARTLEVEYCKVLELLPGGKELLLRAGVGWKEGLVGHAKVGAGTDSQVGYTLLSDKPVIVEELRTEKRFSGTSLLFEHGVVSGVSVIILGREKPFGVLSAHTTRQRRFTEDDIHFLQGVANVLAGTIERRRAEEALRKAHDELEIRVEERTRELAEANTVLQAEIAERKKAAEALRESQQDLNRAQAVALTGSWRLDVRRNELLWSDETHRMFGIPKGTPMSYETFLSYVHPDDREHVDRKWTAALRGEPYDIEHRIVVGDEVKWVREKAELEFDELGVFKGGFGTVQDITERKQAEETLQLERDNLFAILEAMKDGVFIVSPQYTIEYINSELEKDFGPIEDRKCYEYFHNWDQPCPWCKNDEVMAGKTVRWECSFPKNQKTYDLVATPLNNQDGSVSNLEIFHDITERKRNEEELRETQNYLNNLLDYANAPIIVWDPSFRITRFNHAFERLTGLNVNEVFGKKLDILFPEDEREESMGHIRRALAGERWEVVEIPILRKDGIVRTVLWNSATLYSNDGKTAVATIAQGQDITERKQAAEDLRETRDYLNNLLDYANAPIIVWDPSFRITRFNHAFERLTGLSWNNVVGKQLEILFPESEREESMGHIRRAVAGERWEVVEIPILRADGTVRTVLWNSATLYATDGKTVIATIAQGQDITERKQAEEEIIRLNEVLQERAAELEASNRELESFSYSVSHDLREPLRTIDGFSRILQKDYADKLDAEGQRLIDIVRGGTQKMAKLISDLLSFSRIGRKQMEMSEIDMNETVRSVSAELRSAAPDRNLRFNIKELPFAQGDPAMIRQVMVNLMSNAVKFTREKRLAIIQIGSIVQEGENIYYVKDNGVGFDTQYKDKLFRIFQRLHSEEEFEGTGVGLAIVHRIIHRHGGRVWAEGKVGHGATFYFTLPGKEGKS